MTQKKIKVLVISALISALSVSQIIVDNTKVQNIPGISLGFNRLLTSFSDANMITWLFYFVAFWGMWQFIRKGGEILKNRLLVKLLLVISAFVFSFYLILDEIMNQCGYLGEIDFSASLLLNIALKWLGLFVISAVFFTYILLHLLSWRPADDTTSQFSFKKNFATILVSWLPYFLILYPGITTWDTTNQLREYFHIGTFNSIANVYPIARYLIPKSPLHITNHHNFFVTLFYGFSQNIGLTVFKSSNIGFFIVSFVQALLLVFAMTYSLKVFWSACGNGVWTRRFLLVYSLFPLFPIYSLYQVKNVIYSGFLILFVALLCEFYFDNDIIKQVKWQTLFFLDVIGQLISEKYAVYILAICFIFFTLANRKYVKNILLVFLLPILIFQVGINGYLFNKLNVVKGDPIESYGVMLQQTSLYLKQHPNDISKGQYKKINKVLNVSALKKINSPEIVDPLKASGPYKDPAVYRFKTVSANDMANYKRVWLQMFFEHPVTYVEAGLNMGYKYLDFNAKQPLSYYKGLNDFAPLNPGRTITLHADHHDIIATPIKEFNPAKKIISYLLNGAEVFFPTRIFLNGNTIIWIMIILFLACLTISQRLNILNIFLPLILQVPILLISPLDNSQRYMLPIIFCIVLYGMFLIGLKSSRNTKI